MDKAFAYICASAETAPRILKRYCRTVYELGYVPICPASGIAAPYMNWGMYPSVRP